MSGTVRYAGFWRRLAASLVDTLILFIVLTPLTFFFSRGAYFPDLDPGGDILAQLAVMQFDWSYLLIHDLLPMVLVIVLWLRFRATPGKQLLDCEVVDASTHDNLRPGQALLRYIGYFVSLLPLGLGFLWVAWDKKKRGFHDLLAHTVVLRTGAERESIADESLEKLMREAE